MIKQEDRLIEGIEYYVKLRDGWSYDPCIRVFGKFHFTGRLVVQLSRKLVFNLKDNQGSVIIPFDNVEWMVPTTKVEVKVENKKEDYSWED